MYDGDGNFLHYKPLLNANKTFLTARKNTVSEQAIQNMENEKSQREELTQFMEQHAGLSKKIEKIIHALSQRTLSIRGVDKSVLKGIRTFKRERIQMLRYLAYEQGRVYESEQFYQEDSSDLRSEKLSEAIIKTESSEYEIKTEYSKLTAQPLEQACLTEAENELEKLSFYKPHSNAGAFSSLKPSLSRKSQLSHLSHLPSITECKEQSNFLVQQLISKGE